ncbi:Uncharacterised protein [uncultured archaeon]|nr:Uncharacterised protein [uncultured archaeon]
MPGDSKQGSGNQLISLGVLIVLLAILSFALVHYNIVPCGFYSSLGCDVYYSIIGGEVGGKPKVLIVYGEEGMGNPAFMYETLRSPRFSAHVTMKELGLVTMPLLAENQLVIVERAREMKISQIKMFQEYSARGGRIVWVGDAGTKAPESESDLNYFLLKSQRKAGASKEEYIGPWARKLSDKQVSLDYLLGLDYIGNYCELAECSRPDSIVGFLSIPSVNDSGLTNGISPGLSIFGDFSIVQINSSSYQKGLAYLDYGTDFLASPPAEYFWLKQGRQNFGKEFPAILISGTGGRTAYYAFPPEYFVSGMMPIDKATGTRIQYWGIIENMYYGMLYK